VIVGDPHVSGAVRLEDRARVAGMYYQALTRARPAFHLLDDVTGSPVPPDTDDTLRLPAGVDFFDNPKHNWQWYMVALSFRAMAHHPHLGTFSGTQDGDGGRARIRRFLADCPRPATGIAVFGVLEGIRLDAVLLRTLPGMREPLARVHAQALESLQLHDLTDRPPRSQLLTCLLASSLVNEAREVCVSPLVARALPGCLELADWMAAAPPVSSALSAAGELYRVVVGLPPMGAAASSETLSIRPPVASQPLESVLDPQSQRPTSLDDIQLEGMEQFGLTVPQVLYRGVLGTRHHDHRDGGRLSDPAIFAWRDGVEEHEHHHHHGPAGHEHEAEDEEEEEDSKPPEPMAHEHGEVPHWEIPYIPPVSVNGSNVFHYPEWDGIRGVYRPNWCRVVEEPVDVVGFTSYGRDVLDAHRPTVARLLREWSRLPREGLTLRRSLPDGDEIDIDAAIDLRVSLRAGAATNGQVYVRKVPTGRDVVCAVLVDVSMSTADHIEPDPEEGFAVDETAMRLYGKPYRTVLDHEREAALLLAEIMERVSDLSFVYSFSSSGRNLVRVQRIKGVRERSRTTTASRLERLRPLDATRMGAAVRHATAQLRRTEARSKFLVVMSDGLPYDEDYGDDYGERKDAYAISDTVRAFDEAEVAGVRPVLFLTGAQDLGRLADLGPRAVQVPHPRDLVEAVMSRYLRVRSGVRTTTASARSSHDIKPTDEEGEA